MADKLRSWLILQYSMIVVLWNYSKSIILNYSYCLFTANKYAIGCNKQNIHKIKTIKKIVCAIPHHFLYTAAVIVIQIAVHVGF